MPVRLLPFVLAVSFLAFLPAAADAQMKVGLEGGANFATLSDVQANGNAISFASAAGYHGGMFLDLNFGAIGVRPGVYYMNAGPLFEGAPFLTSSNFDITYLSFIADLRYTFGLGPVKPYVFIGPELRTLFSAGKATQDLEENLQTFLMSATGGIGIELSLGDSGMKLYPHIRFIRGLQGITDQEYGVGNFLVVTDGNQHEDIWLIGVGITF